MSITGQLNDKNEWVSENTRMTGYYVIRRLYREAEVAHYNASKREWSFIGSTDTLTIDPLTVMDRVFP